MNNLLPFSHLRWILMLHLRLRVKCCTTASWAIHCFNLNQTNQMKICTDAQTFPSCGFKNKYIYHFVLSIIDVHYAAWTALSTCILSEWVGMHTRQHTPVQHGHVQIMIISMAGSPVFQRWQNNMFRWIKLFPHKNRILIRNKQHVKNLINFGRL